MNDNTADHNARARPAWLLVQTRPALELTVARAIRLHRPEADVYVPLETVWRRTPRRKTAHSRPLIRGYVFAVLDDADLPLMHEIAGVVSFIRAAQQEAPTRPNPSGAERRPVLTAAGFIERLRAAEAAGRFDKTRSERLAKGQRRKVGDRVRITEGPMAGFLAVVDKLTSDQRARVILALWQRPVIMPLALLELAA